MCRRRGRRRGAGVRVHAASEAAAAPSGEVTGRSGRPRGVCAHPCASCRRPGAARARRGERGCGHTDTRGRRHRAGGREAGARAEGTAAHTALTPNPHPSPTRTRAPGLGRPLPFSSLHTFFFLLLGYMLPWGWLAFSCKFPRLTGKQGGVEWEGWEGALGREKVKKAPGPTPLAALQSPPSSLSPRSASAPTRLSPADAATAAPRSLSTRSRLART